MKVIHIPEPESEEEERFLRRIIADMQRRHSRELKPYIDSLVRLRAMSPGKYVILAEPGDVLPKELG
jgi:hypothetical protein